MLQSTEKKIPVVFRRDKYSGEIVAVFPTLHGTGSPDDYVGFTVTRGTITVAPQDLRETNSIGLEESLGTLQDAIKAGFYPLHVAQRISSAMVDARTNDPRVMVPAKEVKAEIAKAKRGRPHKNRSHLFQRKAA